MAWDGDPLLGGRFLSALAGLGSTIGIFAIGRRLSNELGGIIAAFLYAIFPLAMLYDRLALPTPKGSSTPAESSSL